MWKKRLWIKNLIFLCFVSYLLAKIGHMLLLDRLHPSQPYLSQTPAPSKTQGRGIGKKSLRHYRLISQRNVFNSALAGETKSDTHRPTPKRTAPLKKADLNAQLIGTVLGPSQSSFAVIEDLQTRKQELFQVDDMIQDQARVVAISRCSAVVLRDGTEEILECLEPESRTSSTLPPASYSRSSPGHESVTAGKVSESEYVFEEGEVENELGDFNRIMTQVSLNPNFKDGKPDGLKLFSVQPNSFWARAGLKKGDVIRRVNGLELSSMDNAFKAFDAMRREQDVSIEISRGGKRQSIKWEIR